MRSYYLVLIFVMFFAFSCSSGGEDDKGCTKDKDCDTSEMCFGKKCISSAFLCENKTCSNHGTCVVKDGDASCECDIGFVASGLTCIEAPCVKHSDCESNEICQDSNCIDENTLCESVDCGNGTCVVESKEAKCNCSDGYIESGLSCKQDKCKDVQCSVIQECNEDTGACELVVNPCDGVNCGKHGECVYDTDGVSSCECDDSYVDKDKVCVFEIPCVKTAEVDDCNDGLDNNCDGAINSSCSCDGGSELDCYSGDVSRVGIGECKKGKLVCIGGESWSSCNNEVLPIEETCDNKDNDCDGSVDTDPNGDILSKDCYSGDIAETQHTNSRCKAGVYECKAGAYDESNCKGEVTALAEELCGNSIDDNCDGRIDEDCVAPLVTCSNNIARAYIFEAPVSLSAEATDSNGTVVSTSWEFFAKPNGTASTLSQTTGNRTKFTPDTVGEYIVRFTATDNDGEKSYCDINVSAKTRDRLNVTLTWDKGGNSDMDLHLLKPGAASSAWGTISDCFWAIVNPNWGDTSSSLDNPSLDRDDVDGYGPEVVQIERPMDGKYTVGVEYFDDQGEGKATATIKIICNDEEHVYTSSPLNPKQKWAVIDIVWANETCTVEPASRNYQ